MVVLDAFGSGRRGVRGGYRGKWRRGEFGKLHGNDRGEFLERENSALRVLLLVLAVLFRSIPSQAAGETVIRDLKNTKIIRSQEAPHNILNEACIACHQKEKFDFWLLIFKGSPPTLSVDIPSRKGEAEGIATKEAEDTAPKNQYNSHESLGCNFCHFDNPTAVSPRFIVDVKDLCQLCHPGTSLHHLPEGRESMRVTAAIESHKLPGEKGKILCTTCHKLHDSVYGMREEYAKVLWKDRVPNPHGDRMLCFSCHPGRIKEGEEIRLTGGWDVNRLCNDCHLRPGVRKAPHVVDVISSEGTWRMDYLGYPLNKGKLMCTTCHDEVSHGKFDPANPRFLRGGPYAIPDQFCYRCHLEDRENLNNPHMQVDGFGRIREESCRFCHKYTPVPGKPSPNDLDMVGEESDICSNCHQYRPHPDVNHILPIPRDMEARRREYEDRHKVKIPLGEKGKIMCSTCHNPHAKGVLKGEAGVGAGSKWRVPDFREVCAPCHGRY
jgi:hypothetical protein